MAEDSRAGVTRTPVVVTAGDSVVIDPKTDEVIERNGVAESGKPINAKPVRSESVTKPKEEAGNA